MCLTVDYLSRFLVFAQPLVGAALARCVLTVTVINQYYHKSILHSFTGNR